MDVFEKLYGKFSERRKSIKAKAFDPYSVQFSDEFHSLLALAHGAAGRPDTLVKPVVGGIGVVFDDSILLPERIALFPDRDLNRQIYLHKALVAGCIHGDRISSLYSSKATYAVRSLEISVRSREVRHLLSLRFPRFREWSNELEERVESEINSTSSVLTQSERAWGLVASIAKKILSDSDDLTTAEVLKKIQTSIKQSDLEKVTSVPERSLALWTDYIKLKTLLDGGVPSKKGEHKRDLKPRDNKRSKQVSEVETVDLEKEKKKENPVTHSFEKMETADDYQGGYRHADGEDQIEDHQEALDEVNLKHVTRGGDSAESVFEADISDLVETPKIGSDADSCSADSVLLPEWDWRQDRLLSDYCRLRVLKKTEVTPRSEVPDPLSWYSGLIEKQGGALLQWKVRLESLVNQRSWKDRQWDGSDISIDAYVRYLSDCRCGHQGDARLYLRSVRASREFSTFVLLDQSLSTDSWVMNKRVLDVELESIALMSFLLRELDEPFAVGGTYSHTRHQCSLNIYKDFNDSWDSFLTQAPSIEATGYTRLGPSIRYATDLLVKEGGRQKLLVLLTDGKPTDYDRYEGRYGIEDIRHANLEAKQKGVQVRALAIESSAKDYFPHLFGKSDYQIIQDPAKLPEALFKIFLDSIRS